MFILSVSEDSDITGALLSPGPHPPWQLPQPWPSRPLQGGFGPGWRETLCGILCNWDVPAGKVPPGCHPKDGVGGPGRDPGMAQPHHFLAQLPDGAPWRSKLSLQPLPAAAGRKSRYCFCPSWGSL